MKKYIPSQMICTRFCKVDDILYSDLPRAKFTYTEQIGKGGSMCDYSYKKR